MSCLTIGPVERQTEDGTLNNVSMESGRTEHPEVRTCCPVYQESHDCMLAVHELAFKALAEVLAFVLVKFRCIQSVCEALPPFCLSQMGLG